MADQQVAHIFSAAASPAKMSLRTHKSFKDNTDIVTGTVLLIGLDKLDVTLFHNKPTGN